MLNFENFVDQKNLKDRSYSECKEAYDTYVALEQSKGFQYNALVGDLEQAKSTVLEVLQKCQNFLIAWFDGEAIKEKYSRIFGEYATLEWKAPYLNTQNEYLISYWAYLLDCNWIPVYARNVFGATNYRAYKFLTFVKREDFLSESGIGAMYAGTAKYWKIDAEILIEYYKELRSKEK